MRKMERLAVAGLLLAMASPAGAIQAYRAQEIQPYQAQEIQPHQAQDIQPYQAQEIQQHQSQEVQQHQAQDIQPYSSQRVRRRVPNDAGQTPVNVERVREGSDVAASPSVPQPEKQKKAKAATGARALVGVWQTNIPGAVYTTPSGQPGYDILHVSSGVAAGLMKINANGTYSWNSYGGKKGKWVETTDPEYPIEIIDTVENRRWKVGYSASKGTLIIWSGSFWYEGRRAAIKK